MTRKPFRADASRINGRRLIVIAYCRCGALIGEQEPRYVAKACDACKQATAARAKQSRGSSVIPERVKAEVLARDGMVCRHCGKAVRVRRAARYDLAKDTMEFDHVIPLARGGRSTVKNVVVAWKAA